MTNIIYDVTVIKVTKFELNFIKINKNLDLIILYLNTNNKQVPIIIIIVLQYTLVCLHIFPLKCKFFFHKSIDTKMQYSQVGMNEFFVVFRNFSPRADRFRDLNFQKLDAQFRIGQFKLSALPKS